jgi:hypothetical protein
MKMLSFREYKVLWGTKMQINLKTNFFKVHLSATENFNYKKTQFSFDVSLFPLFGLVLTYCLLSNY